MQDARVRGTGLGRQGRLSERFSSLATTSPIGFSAAGRRAYGGRAHRAGTSGSVSGSRCCVWLIPWKGRLTALETEDFGETR